MRQTAVFAALFLFLPTGLFADPLACDRKACTQVFQLDSSSLTNSYGLLLAAPMQGCHRVRFRIETLAQTFLGQTPALSPGEVSLVRIGRGFSEGETTLTIVAEGCTAPPALVRRVTLAKRSPDHGARAARFGL